MQRRFLLTNTFCTSASSAVLYQWTHPRSLLEISRRSCANSSAISNRVSNSNSNDPGITTSTTNDASPLQQLYKSSHRGRGTTPMPKPFQEKRLKSHGVPLQTAEPLLGSRSSCSEDVGPVPSRPLTPLQKRQLQFQNKAAFVLTPQALRRVKYLLSQYTTLHPQLSSKATEPNATSSSPREDGNNGRGDTAVAAPTGIRIGVRRRGCSGYSYTVNYYFEPTMVGDMTKPSSMKRGKQPGGMSDVVVVQDGVKVVVDADALFYVIGTEMDYIIRNVEEKFTFKNPNQKYGCGCEESFMPFDEDDLEDM